MRLPIQNSGGSQYSFDGLIIQGMVLCRMPPYQAELFVGFGPGLVPNHAHPNVDSFEVALSGDIRFIVEGRLALPEEVLRSHEDGTMLAMGSMVRVRAGAWHGAMVGEGGGAFLSLQRWLNGVAPTSVALDWEGPGFGRR